ncbi:MAG TPA: META domain-containing protein [Casimicrobiaceae bacterium]|nr:META domain-containing protein [Casimicrobiaceae bacterium]
MAGRMAVIVAMATLASACAGPNLSAQPGAPTYGAAGAMPPTLTASANDLSIPTWQWQRTQLPDGRATVAAEPERYTLKFEGGGRVLVRADCNRGSGAYEVNGSAMKIAPIATTRMACPPDSQDAAFMQGLSVVTDYSINDRELALTLANGGTMRLRAQ